MKLQWKTFKENIQKNKDKSLRFTYADDQFVESDYHITEFKLANIQSIDCGGSLDTWDDLILQVLEPEMKEDKSPMAVSKLISILHKVESKISIPENSILRVEFGNTKFAMRQFFVSEVNVTEDSLVVTLSEGQPECKAADACGILQPETASVKSSCCGPAVKLMEVNVEPAIQAKKGCC